MVPWAWNCNYIGGIKIAYDESALVSSVSVKPSAKPHFFVQLTKVCVNITKIKY